MPKQRHDIGYQKRKKNREARTVRSVNRDLRTILHAAALKRKAGCSD